MAEERLRVSRRGAVTGLTAALVPAATFAASRTAKEKREQKEGSEDVTATEDLMREHGVLRRLLIVYSEMAPMLARGGHVDAMALNATAKLFRDFGEAYHERMLEEEHIFPELRRAGESSNRLVDVLIDQHQRGRDITQFVIETTDRGTIGGGALPMR